MKTRQRWRQDRFTGSVTREWRLTGTASASMTVDLRRGARITSLVADAHELLVAPSGDAPYVFGDGMFAMAPYAGRVDHARFRWQGRDHQLPLNAPPHSVHGVVADAVWGCTDPGVFRVDLDDRWPLGGYAVEEISTFGDGLEIVLRVANNDREMPANPGLHPWFRRDIEGADVRLNWPAPRVYAIQDGITSRSLATRDPAVSSWTAPASADDPVLTWPGRLELTLSSVHARCWVIHETETAICVEPQLAPGDALNAGDSVTVSPGRDATIDLRLRFRSLRHENGKVPAPVRAPLDSSGTPPPRVPRRPPGRS